MEHPIKRLLLLSKYLKGLEQSENQPAVIVIMIVSFDNGSRYMKHL